VGYENEKVGVSKYFETGGFTNILPHGKKRMSATVQNTSKKQKNIARIRTV
jgi:hypothetical protein